VSPCIFGRFSVRATQLTILETLPDRLLTAGAGKLHEFLSGPTLIHLPGRRPEPLFVSVLLHGNEEVGLCAIQRVLAEHDGRELPRALSIFIGNVEAAHHNLRHLDTQPDFNRIWGPNGAVSEEHEIMANVAAHVTRSMRERRCFASIDLHNNTGHNPHYACVTELGHEHLHLATLFSRTVVYFRIPHGVQTMAFAPFCPAITCECGRVGDELGVMRAAELITAALQLAEHPAHPIPPGDVHLFRSVGVMKVAESATLSFSAAPADLQFRADFDWFNFRELAPGIVLGNARQPLGLSVLNERNEDVTDDYLELADGELRLRRPVMPSMLTLDERVIRQDCLGYFMERLQLP
jgi:hypothetical protein